jgi:cell wall-associated NlpC family hydrolase
MNKLATAIGTTGLGFMLIWSGVTNAGVLSTVQHLFMGVAPIPGQPQSLPKFNVNVGTLASYQTQQSGGTSSGSTIADAAMRHQNVPYVWGGKDLKGWDCYGMLTYVLHSDLGYNLPNNTYTGYLEFLSWGGKYQISESEVQAGDIVIWPTHCGIAISPTQMISAENETAGTRVTGFREGGPLVPEPMTFYRIKGALIA